MATHDDGNSYIRIATEPCSIQDQYCKKIANQQLRKNYAEGRYIRVPITVRRNVTHREVRDMIVNLFGNSYSV
jgi:hypothetical protein